MRDTMHDSPVASTGDHTLKPFVTIIVPCRNEAAHVESALLSMLGQQGIDGQFEIVVAEGGSDDGTRAILDRMAALDRRIQVVDNPRQIVSTGLNLAIERAHGEVIVRMDTHSVYAPDYVAQCLAELNSTGAQNVGGPARTRATSYFQQANALAYRSRFSVGGARFHDPNHEGWVDTVTYGCWRKETLVALGLFDEQLIRNQDDELNLRLTRAGGRIWQSPKIKSWYFPRSSLGALFRQYQQYGYWKVRVIQKHRIPASIRHLVPGGFVATVLLLAVTSAFLPAAGTALGVLLALYLSANLGASIAACRSIDGLRYLPVMPAVFAAYHMGYGWGFLRGVVDFMVLKRLPSRSKGKLTR